jgi:hypothetical protein
MNTPGYRIAHDIALPYSVTHKNWSDFCQFCLIQDLGSLQKRKGFAHPI